MFHWFNIALAIFAIVQFTGVGVSFASPEASARVERLDRAFREVSVTTFEAAALGMAEGMWEKFLIRGKGISLDDNATLHVKYDRCNNQSIVGLRTEGDNPVVSTFPCEGAKWKLIDAKYNLVNLELRTIEVKEKSGPQKRGPFNAKWFEIDFSYIGENGFAVPDASIECSGRQACETMADDLRALVKSVQTLHDAVTRISENYRGIVFQRQVSSQGETHVLVAKADLIDTNLAARLRTRQQFCMRTPDQDCDRDNLWRERIALADITKLSSGVEIDDVVFVSDDKTIGVVRVKCAEGGCWSKLIGGKDGKITGGLNKEEIHCRIGNGCQQMKKDLELLIALATAKDVPVQKGEAPADNVAPAGADKGDAPAGLDPLPACCGPSNRKPKF